MSRATQVRHYLRTPSTEQQLRRNVLAREWRGRRPEGLTTAFPEGEAIDQLRLRHNRWEPRAAGNAYYAGLRIALREVTLQSVRGTMRIVYKNGPHTLDEELPLEATTPMQAARAAYGVARRRLDDFLGTRH